MDRHCLHALRHNASGVGKSDTCEVLYAYVTYNREPQVVQEGPSEKVCHLGYLRTLSTWVYAGLAIVNWIAAAIITLTTASAYQSALTEKTYACLVYWKTVKGIRAAYMKTYTLRVLKRSKVSAAVDSDK
jgi:hypothetical protein